MKFPLLSRFCVRQFVGTGGLGNMSVMGIRTPKQSYIRKSTNPLCRVFVQFPTGGSGGIRTPVGLHPNAFQARRVMTASLRFRKDTGIRCAYVTPEIGGTGASGFCHMSHYSTKGGKFQAITASFRQSVYPCRRFFSACAQRSTPRRAPLV